MIRREATCAVLAGGLVVAGTLSTGILPPTTAGQVLAGGIIVAGFLLLVTCFSR